MRDYRRLIITEAMPIFHKVSRYVILPTAKLQTSRATPNYYACPRLPNVTTHAFDINIDDRDVDIIIIYIFHRRLYKEPVTPD